MEIEPKITFIAKGRYPKPTLDGLYEKVYQDYWNSLYSYARLRISEPQQALELTQQTLVSCYLALDKTVSRNDLMVSAWLYRSLKNKIISELRKQKSRKTDQLSNDNPDHHIPATLGNPEGKAFEMETKQEVNHVLEKISERHRKALTLRHYEGLSYEEIAAIMDTTRAKIKEILRRGNQAFRREYSRTHPQLVNQSRALLHDII